uniref:Uncharacterized protein n=1 Tax=Oryza barthii TaxID=65489 RepID=A0A0D3ELQ6_9ORYZ
MVAADRLLRAELSIDCVLPIATATNKTRRLGGVWERGLNPLISERGRSLHGEMASGGWRSIDEAP